MGEVVYLAQRDVAARKPKHNAHEMLIMGADAFIIDVIRSWVEVAQEAVQYGPLPSDLRRDGMRMKALLDRQPL